METFGERWFDELGTWSMETEDRNPENEKVVSGQSQSQSQSQLIENWSLASRHLIVNCFVYIND